MDRSRQTVSRRSLCLLLTAVCVLGQGACQPAAEASSIPSGSLTGAGCANGGFGISEPARRRNLDRAGNARPGVPLLRRAARSPDQCARPILWHGCARARDRADTESGAVAGWELFGDYAGKHGRIKARAPFEGYREVFARHGQPDL
jgi:hypothetical protein